eukprot:1064786-Pyramimonas_sp.AAC.1
MSTLCFGQLNGVDALELCGGIAGISQLAVKRRLSSGGKFDKRTGADLGYWKVQQSILRFLRICKVGLIILQPACRITGLPSYFNAMFKCNIWWKHNPEYSPHSIVCGPVARTQDDLRRSPRAPGWMRYLSGARCGRERVHARRQYMNAPQG